MNKLKEVKKNVCMINKLNPFYIPLILLREILTVSSPFIEIFLGAQIINQLVEMKPASEVLVSILWLVGSMFVIRLIQDILRYSISIHRGYIFDNKNKFLSLKATQMDYDIQERKRTKEMMAKAEDSSEAMAGFSGYLDNIVYLIGGVVSFILSLATMTGLFTTQVVTDKGGWCYFITSPYSTVVLFIVIGISVLINIRSEKVAGERNYNDNMRTTQDSRIYWFFFNLMFNLPMGKDIRLFHMQPLIIKQEQISRTNIENVKRETLKKTLKMQNFATAAHFVFLLIAYFFVGIKTVLGILTLGELTKYVGMITLMQQRITVIFSNLTKIHSQNAYLKTYNDYMELEEHKYEGTLPIEQRLDNEYELEFKHVSFHYPNNDKLILKDISFKLKIGNKLAIVGQNGAGKTTFIKLLCRLYDPTEGEILLNGINIQKYSFEEYQKLFAVVFQDFNIFAFSVAENVAASTTYDEKHVWESLKEAGIDERVKRMKNGIKTKLMKDQQEEGEEGLEISGGEKQKIALARALYKDAPIVILDEPTSALDPIAEQDIYERFNDMVLDKTAVFISHRMSSCKFCNQVIVFEDGQIIQNGTHEQLLGEEDGLYAKMWNAQAQYYTKTASTSDDEAGDAEAVPSIG